MKYYYLLLLIVLSSIRCTQVTISGDNKQTKPNILFIAIDDLRPELGCYGSPIAKTPNIDAIAAQGLQFNKAYCQQAICSPSRASLMTGARPETINIIENYAYFRDENPDIITLPQHFIANGYETVFCGKIYHPRFTDDEKSWSRKPTKLPYPKSKLTGGYVTEKNQKIFLEQQALIREKYGEDATEHYALGRGPAFEAADVPDNTYVDGYMTDVAIATLKELSKHPEKPFFLGFGFRLPHLDWNAPTKYWDMYDPQQIPMTDQDQSPKLGAAMGLHASFELRVRHGIPKSGPIEGKLARTLKHGYLASVSYVDAQIGRMMKALDESGLGENTIIMLWSDHGWHLGDMGVWGKATNYEIATRVPMIISTPNMPANIKGQKTDALVELIDMYPTLCELSGIELPDHLEGHSFAPLIEDPGQTWKKAAFSLYPNPALREWAANPLTAGMRETYFGPLIEEVESKILAQQKDKWDRSLFENNLMGYTMRTQKHRLVVWKDRTKKDSEPLFIELYDHVNDPKETENIASKNPELVNGLMILFNKGWKGSLPT